MRLNPAAQYADDRNLRARQRFWQHQDPYFDIVGWVLDLARLSPGMRVLDAGCGNGLSLRALRDRQAMAVGCDLSMGMLRAASHRALLNADITALPLRDGAVDVALAIHMLYHVPSRQAAISELRRVVAAGGTCIAVTNGSRHTRSLRAMAERAVRRESPGWQMRPAIHAFTAENAAAQLGAAFGSLTCVRPASNPPVVIRDAAVAADPAEDMTTILMIQRAAAPPGLPILLGSAGPVDSGPQGSGQAAARAVSGRRRRPGCSRAGGW